MDLTPEAFAAEINVSRETLDRLRRYADVLADWQQRINLVAASTMDQLWRRHMLDSAQLLPLLPAGTTRLIDLGSGAGFPGLVLAILGVPEVHLVEATGKKCAFLAAAAAAAGLIVGRDLIIHNRRIEDMPPEAFDAVTARACAPLDRLLPLAARFCGPQTTCLFLKGAKMEDELTVAGRQWTMSVERFASLSDPTGVILRVTKVARARDQHQRQGRR